MKRKMIALLSGVLPVALLTPVAAFACDGACGGGNNTSTWQHHHHEANQGQQPGAGEGLNNGINLSLDQSQQKHNDKKNHRVWSSTDHKWHTVTTNG